VPVDVLSQLLSQSEHIRGLIRESAAALESATAGMRHEHADGAVLSAATRQLHEAVDSLTALKQVLQEEIRARTLLDHQLAAAFEQEEGARRAALRDHLTGLSNRVLFHDRLEHGIAQATRHGWMLAVMFVDLNNFKNINDTYGHEAGDAVLKSIAFRLAHTTRDEDTVSRFGGDEFLCLLTPLHEEKHIGMIATKILAAIQVPCDVPGRVGSIALSVRGSIGISVFPRDGTSPAELVRRADEAMYVAKENKSGFAFAQ
jgi:diguanylate cyclase (GGDEF)-like protein